MDIYVRDYGILGNQKEGVGRAVQRLIDSLPQEPLTLHFEPEEYHLYSEEGTPVPYRMSNTTSEKQLPDPTRNVAIRLKGVSGLTIDGHGATFMYHGRMTQMVIEDSQDITIKNLNFDYADPLIFEGVVERKGVLSFDLKVSENSYVGDNTWKREGWSGVATHSVKIRKKDTQWKRVRNPLKTPSLLRKIDAGVIRVYNPLIRPSVGDIYHFREDLRDEMGFFIVTSKGVSLEDIHFFVTPGLGLLGQDSEDLFFTRIQCVPRKGRTCSGFADFMHLSSCRGRVEVIDSVFQGAHDDCINIHGTHLKVVKQERDRETVLRYMHYQTFGFSPARVGDTVALVDQKSLVPFFEGVVLKVEEVNPREYRILWDRQLPTLEEATLVANISANPSVLLEGNLFTQVPTRGVLITTSGPSVIRNNTFRGTYMSAILVANDGSSWYESGEVSNLLIEKNHFESCGLPTIAVLPEVKKFVKPVHGIITIRDNHFSAHSSITVRGVECIEIGENQCKGKIKVSHCSSVNVASK